VREIQRLGRPGGRRQYRVFGAAPWKSLRCGVLRGEIATARSFNPCAISFLLDPRRRKPLQDYHPPSG
jgi:hypothetical protein